MVSGQTGGLSRGASVSILASRKFALLAVSSYVGLSVAGNVVRVAGVTPKKSWQGTQFIVICSAQRIASPT